MDILLTCEQNCAPYVEKEVQLRNIKYKEAQLFDSCLILKDLTKEDIIKCAYLLQTPLRISLLLGHFQVSLSTEKTVIALDEFFKTYEFKEASHISSAIKCTRKGSHEYNSVDVTQEAGRLLKRYYKDKTKKELEIDVKRPKQLFFIQIENKDAFIGLDLLGKDAAKRQYKVFSNPHSIKGPVAACLLMAADWNFKETLLDPFASGGVISIEAALMATNKSIHFYDKSLACKHYDFFKDMFEKTIQDIDNDTKKAPQITSIDSHMPNITAAKKNAKLAGIEKDISYSKLDIEWIDTKFSKQTVDKIVCLPLEESRATPRQKVQKIHQDIFYQAEFILTEKGSVTLLCQKPDQLVIAAKKYNFKPTKQELIWTGKLSRWIITFEKDKTVKKDI